MNSNSSSSPRKAPPMGSQSMRGSITRGSISNKTNRTQRGLRRSVTIDGTSAPSSLRRSVTIDITSAPSSNVTGRDDPSSNDEGVNREQLPRHSLSESVKSYFTRLGLPGLSGDDNSQSSSESEPFQSAVMIFGDDREPDDRPASDAGVPKTPEEKMDVRELPPNDEYANTDSKMPPSSRVEQRVAALRRTKTSEPALRRTKTSEPKTSNNRRQRHGKLSKSLPPSESAPLHTLFTTSDDDYTTDHDPELGSSNPSLMDDESENEGDKGSPYSLSFSPVVKGLLGLLGSILVVVPFTFAVVGSQNNNNATPQEANNDTEPAATTRLNAALPNSTLTAASQPNTPQYHAYHWLLQNPWLLQETPEWRIQQRMALATFYYAFDGPQWATPDNKWLQYNVSECEWPQPSFREPTCHDNGTFASLQIVEMDGFQGSMPPEIGMLTHLQQLQFAHLEHVSLSDHLMTPSLQALTALTSFQAVHLQESSEIPATLADHLPNLQDLDLSQSRLMGHLPSQLGLLTRLTSLQLHQNFLQDAIPSQLGQLSRLQVLKLKENQFAEEMPWAQNWTAMKVLDLSGNQLTGSFIPTTTLTKMTALQQLHFHGGNRFTGSLPSQVGFLTNLTALQLGGNRLNGTLPVQLDHLTGLQKLDLLDNHFTGTIPWRSLLSYLEQLAELSLGQNQFVGTLPTTLGRNMVNNRTTQNLRTLDVSHNQLDGSIPSQVGLLTALTSLFLQANTFTDALPSELGQLTQLETLYVHDNPELVEEVPQELCEKAAFDFSNFQFGWCQGRTECCA